MNKVLCVNKPAGLTPLQVLDDLRNKRPEYKDEKLSYAGRLDPMASGVMLVLVGEKNKNREEYLKLDKEYEFEILFGIRSDTYDLMGIPELSETDFDIDKIDEMVKGLVGNIEQTYPPYSGKTINGVKMFELAKENKLPKKLPLLSGEIYEAEIIGRDEKTFGEAKKNVNNTVPQVIGDFRQGTIVNSWNKLGIDDDSKLEIVKIRLSCSSGVFMRGIANELGMKMGGGALAYSIKRVGVDKYSLEDCIRI